jgi:hypothetical protein
MKPSYRWIQAVLHRQGRGLNEGWAKSGYWSVGTSAVASKRGLRIASSLADSPSAAPSHISAV